MKRFTTFLFVAVLCTTLWAQTDIMSRLNHTSYSQGVVTVTQDPRLERMIGNNATTVTTTPTGEHTIKVQGYRVQVYAGNNSGTARKVAYDMASKVKELLPDHAVYTNFISPRWICRVGDFRSVEEADVVMRTLRATGSFKELSIVKVQINVSY